MDAEQSKKIEALYYEMFDKLLVYAQSNLDNESLVPTYIPDGFSLKEISTVEAPGRVSYIASFSNGEKMFRVYVKPHIGEDSVWFEKSGETFETYPHLGTDYYIFSNLEQHRAVWIKNAYECNISGDLSVEEIKTMIKSIGKG